MKKRPLTDEEIRLSKKSIDKMKEEQWQINGRIKEIDFFLSFSLEYNYILRRKQLKQKKQSCKKK